MIPTALALEKGSEANAPLARAILGGLIAGEPATLFVMPALYVILVDFAEKFVRWFKATFMRGRKPAMERVSL